MSTVKTGWLKDSNGEKFAPKTLMSQVQTSDGMMLEEKIQNDLNAAVNGFATEGYVDNKVGTLGNLAGKSTVEKTDLSADIQASLDKADSALQSTEPVVRYTPQTLTDAQKKQARENIGAGDSGFSGDYNDLINQPPIPSIAGLATESYVDNAVAQKSQVQFVIWGADD